MHLCRTMECETRSVLGITGLLQLLPCSQGTGIAQELTKGAFGWGSPPKFKRRSRHLYHWMAVWPGQAGAGFGHCAYETWACLCMSLCFLLVVSRFLGKFLVKAPSLAWLIQGKRRLVCTCVEIRVFKGRTKAILGGFIGLCSLGNFLDPIPILLPSLTTKAVGSFERKSQTSFNLSKTGPLPSGECRPWWEEHAGLGSLSRLSQSTGRGTGLCRAQGRWTGA